MQFKDSILSSKIAYWDVRARFRHPRHRLRSWTDHLFYWRIDLLLPRLSSAESNKDSELKFQGEKHEAEKKNGLISLTCSLMLLSILKSSSGISHPNTWMFSWILSACVDLGMTLVPLCSAHFTRTWPGLLLSLLATWTKCINMTELWTTNYELLIKDDD